MPRIRVKAQLQSTSRYLNTPELTWMDLTCALCLAGPPSQPLIHLQRSRSSLPTLILAAIMVEGGGEWPLTSHLVGRENNRNHLRKHLGQFLKLARSYHVTSQFHCYGKMPRKMVNMQPQRPKTCTQRLHTGIVGEKPKGSTVRKSINWWTDKQNAVCPHDGLVPGNRKRLPRGVP